jgi:hypothetical protein
MICGTFGLLRRMVHALSNQIPNLLTCIVEYVGSPFQVSRRDLSPFATGIHEPMGENRSVGCLEFGWRMPDAEVQSRRYTANCALPCRCRSLADAQRLHFEWRTRSGHGIFLLLTGPKVPCHCSRDCSAVIRLAGSSMC